MKKINNYIIEKLHINKDTELNISKEEKINKITETINDILQKKFNLNNKEYIIGKSTKDNFVPKKTDEITSIYIYFTSKGMNKINNNIINKIINALNNELDIFITSLKKDKNNLNGNTKIKLYLE